MVEIILAGLIGVLLGVGGAKALATRQPTCEYTTATKQQEFIQQLTDLDVIKELCNPEQTKTQEGLLLCREMTCLKKRNIRKDNERKIHINKHT